MRDTTVDVQPSLAPVVSHSARRTRRPASRNAGVDITSADFLGSGPFRFKGDVKKRVAFIIGKTNTLGNAAGWQKEHQLAINWLRV
jgi:hypothetical protein